MDERFLLVASHTLEAEGYFSDDAHDPGGATIYGVSKNNWPTYYARIIAKDTKEEQRIEALKFYENEFWDKLFLPQLHSINVAAEVFDTAVNLGHFWGVRLLQQSVNFLIENNAPSNAQLTLDGRMGPMTVSTTNDISGQYEMNLVALQNQFQGLRYWDLYRDNPTKHKRFIAGWMKRTLTIRLDGPAPPAASGLSTQQKKELKAAATRAKKLSTEAQALNETLAGLVA